MASKGHEFMLEIIHMKMKQIGYVIVSSDNHYRTIKFKIPPPILRHRPDALGYRAYDNSVCIGEAKYYGDLSSERTYRQVRDFVNLTYKKRINVRLVLGIPLSEKEHFLRLLKENNLKLNNKIILIEIPDRLIPKEIN